MEPQPVILSETSTIILSPEGEGEPLRLKKVHQERESDGEIYRSERPDLNDMANVVKDIANFCVVSEKQKRL